MYKITIEKIEEKVIEEKEYSVLWEKDWEKEWGYVSVPNTREVETEIYKQVIDNDHFNLTDVIVAFNK
jgi:hypothetical protein